MEKIKNALSSHSSEPKHKTGTASASGGEGEGDYHPIYDQMTGRETTTSGPPTKTTDNAPHFSNTASLNPPDSAKSFQTPPTQDSSGIHGDAIRGARPNAMGDEGSTASIKSGVIGFPQGEDQHAARQNIPSERSATGGQQGQSSAFVAGTGPHTLHRQKDHDNLRAEQSSGRDFASTGASGQPLGMDSRELPATTDRSFPLAGGVTSHNQAEKPTYQGDTTSTLQATQDRQLGTKDTYVSSSDHAGREEQAGAAAAATATGGVASFGDSNHGPQGGYGTSVASPDALRAEHELRYGHHHDDSRNTVGNEGLARSNISGVGSSTISQSEHENPAQDKSTSATMFTSGPHVTDTANRLDPHLHIPGEFPETPMETPGDNGQSSGEYLTGTGGSSEPTLIQKPANVRTAPPSNTLENNHGRDATIEGGVVAASAGAYTARKEHEKESPNVSREAAYEGPYSSTKLDPRVNPRASAFEEQRFDPHAKTEASPHASTPEFTHSNARGLDEDDHHYGRDAGLVGAGAAAAGGAYYASEHDDKLETGPASKTIGPHKSNVANVLDPRVKPDPKLQKESKPQSSSPATAATAAASYDQHKSTQPAAAMNEQRYDTAAPGAHDPAHHYGRDTAVAGGLGAAGVGAYATSRQPDDASRQPQLTQDKQQPGTHQRYDSVQDPKQQHQVRNTAGSAALAGAAGAGAGYAASQTAQDAEKQRLAQQIAYNKELEHQRKDQHKEFEKKQKEQAKALDDQQKHFEKHQAQDQEQHNKLVAAKDKAHQRELEKEQAKHQQEAEREEDTEESKEKKHGLLGFLHRDKKKSPEHSPRHSAEYGAAGATTAAGAYGVHEGRNRLHKNPPKGHPARAALESGKREHMGIDGPIGDPNQISGDHETRSGTFGAHPIGDEKNTVIEPHTGLPMNVERYGDGHGGTDGSNTVEGHHQVPGATSSGGETHGVTDWDAIKKANTPY